MNQDEIDYVRECIKQMPSDGIMAEWGSGGSTCAWLETLSGSQRLFSVEHTEAWYNRVNRAIAAEFGDVSSKFKYYHIPEQFGFEHGYGNLIEEHPTGTDNYLLPPNDEWWNADIFFIDGIVRATCAAMVLLKHKKKKPAVFIHDYVGRENWYSWASQLFDTRIVGDTSRGSTLARLFID